MSNICVFCSASDAISNKWKEDACNIGRLIAVNGDNLVTGCSVNGLMGMVARGFDEEKEEGQKHIGVYPTSLSHIEKPYPADEIIQLPTLDERQHKLVELGDEFWILAGGVGTMYELFEVLTKTAVGEIHPKRIRIYNIDGFYHDLFNQLLTMVGEDTLSLSTYNSIEEADHWEWYPL